VGRLSMAGGAILIVTAAWLASPSVAAAFDGFGDSTADSTYADAITFEIEYDGPAPERMELLVETPGGGGAFVFPVDPGDGVARFVWDTSVDYVTPNTLITYRWRATDGETATETEPAQLRYDDDRPALDWQAEQLGEATVHWYGDAATQARRFGELTADGVARAEELLGTELAGPVDIFVYDSREDFFAALGPGAREWTGAAAFSELRTIFMWLGGGTADYLEVAMLHEVTHIVFHDATDNPYHEPARWLNEGIATWSETSSAGNERSIVEVEASGAGLFAFEAITEQFPIGERGGRLSYAQGTTMVDLIVERFGEEALAAIAAAYRDGASDAEALEAGTGMTAEDLYAAYYEAYGVDAPQPIPADPIPPSTVDRPTAGEVDEGGVDPGAQPPPDEGAPTEPDPAPDPNAPWLVVLLAVVAAAVIAVAVLLSRRAVRAGR
jgi:uncharacterized protein YndB with AHSA1/START domain